MVEIIRGPVQIVDVEAALAELQPRLRIVSCEPQIAIEGPFVLNSPEGPFDEYEIRLELSYDYPNREPKVYETGRKIPRSSDRHINSTGDCCITVWEEWLLVVKDTSFRAYLQGPIHEFFLSQWWFDKTGHWRFGQRSHGLAGLTEAYSDVLGMMPEASEIFYFLQLLAGEWPRGHLPCPCDSGKKFRRCHRGILVQSHEKISPDMARRMLQRLQTQASGDITLLEPKIAFPHRRTAVHRVN